MKTVLLASAALAAVASIPAYAADIPLKARPPASYFSWTGCYLGGNFGGLWGDTKWSSTAGDTPPFINNQTVSWVNYSAGGQVGCNYQTGAFVLGVEADLSSTDVNKFGLNDISGRDEIL